MSEKEKALTDYEMAAGIVAGIQSMWGDLAAIAGTYDHGWRCPEKIDGAREINEAMKASSELMAVLTGNARRYNAAQGRSHGQSNDA